MSTGIGTAGTRADRKLDLQVDEGCVETHGPRWGEEPADIHRSHGMNTRGVRLRLLSHPWEPYPALTWNLQRLALSKIVSPCHYWVLPMSGAQVTARHVNTQVELPGKESTGEPAVRHGQKTQTLEEARMASAWWGTQGTRGLLVA